MSNAPKYHAFAVKNRGESKKAVWIRLGSAWPTKDGDGLNLRIDALPLEFDGQITLLQPKDKTADSFEGEAA